MKINKKQIKTIEKHKKQLVKSDAFVEKESILFDKEEKNIPLDKEKKIFHKCCGKNWSNVKIHNSVNFEKLIHYFKGSPKNIYFNDFIDGKTLFNDIKFKRIGFADVAGNLMEFKSKLHSTRVGGNKLEEQLLFCA